MSQNTLQLEILSGPLDGHIITVQEATEWSRLGESSFSFPWDTELGNPQARFYAEEGNWWLAAAQETPHGTYCANRVGRIEGKFQLQVGDVLKASKTWLRVD